MVSRCAQRQIPKPADGYNDYAVYISAEAAFQQKFPINPMFVQFKSEFGANKAYNSCSYLQDFVKNRSTGEEDTKAIMLPFDDPLTAADAQPVNV